MDDRELGFRLPDRPVLPESFAFQDDVERTVDPDEQRLEQRPETPTLRQPAGVEEHVVDDDVEARVRQGGDRSMHARHETSTERSGLDAKRSVVAPLGPDVPKDLRPQRLVELRVRQGEDEAIDPDLQPRVGQRRLERADERGLAAARGSVEEDDPTDLAFGHESGRGPRFWTNWKPNRPFTQRWPSVTDESIGDVTLTISLSCTCRSRTQPTPQYGQIVSVVVWALSSHVPPAPQSVLLL